MAGENQQSGFLFLIPGLTQTRLYSHRSRLEAEKYGLSFKEDVSYCHTCTIYGAETKALICCVRTAQLICTFVFAYTACWLMQQLLVFLLFFLQQSQGLLSN